jgi:hypothetical protein
MFLNYVLVAWVAWKYIYWGNNITIIRVMPLVVSELNHKYCLWNVILFLKTNNLFHVPGMGRFIKNVFSMPFLPTK